MEQPKIERLLLLLRLLTGNRYYTLTQLAERMCVSERTIYRYIESFRSVNLEVIQDNGYIRIKSSDTLTSILKISNTTYEGRMACNIANIDCAIDSKCQVCLSNYASAHSTTIRDRLVEPFEMCSSGNYFWAYDVEDGCCKRFHAGRAERISVFATSWQYADKHRSWSVDVFNTHGEFSYDVVLKLSIRARNLLLEEYPMAEVDLTPSADDDNFFYLSTTLHALEGAGRFVLGLPNDVTIVEGNELKEYVRGVR